MHRQYSVVDINPLHFKFDFIALHQLIFIQLWLPYWDIEDSIHQQTDMVFEHSVHNTGESWTNSRAIWIKTNFLK